MKRKTQKKNKVDAVVSKYEKELRPTYKSFCSKIKELIESFLCDKNIRIHSITYREKSPTSLREKILREGKSYKNPLREITDLAGVRIIAFFPSDIDKIVPIIESEFIVDKGQSKDKRLPKDSLSFGYASVHKIVELNKSRCKLAEYSRWAGLKCEIQIRTILQHAWAEIEHDIVYKSNKEEIPSEIRRRFASLSGLLEIADREFEQLRLEKEKDELQKRTPRIIKPDSSNELKKEVEELKQKIDMLQSMGSKLTFDDYMSKAASFHYRELYNNAMESLNKAIKLKPDDPLVLVSKGIIFSKTGKPKEALRAYDKAIRLEPKNPDAWYNKGNALGDIGKYKEALRAYDKAIRLEPKYSYAWCNKGDALLNVYSV